ncbi:MAG: hypothetical protein ACK5CE_12385 [Actinomycetes bacterium]|jgi:hypothetical protein|uniref:Unannotated protein n=1 Tax=freshwater metagenome TaxID=449393 RepID=A0A6J6BLZ4_9ZZZZ|nr:hypothetical protein [Actinomycetota bacterium]
MNDVTVDELNAAEWADQQDFVCRRFLDMSADEFRMKFRDGAFDDVEVPDGLMVVLALFPDLD